jgi:GT2 family glycosyltransferase
VSRPAAVVIGRNEGPRLARCLRSIGAGCSPVVYVDSASTDGSVEAARACGAEVVALDLSIPFTFGRARNAGAARVLELAPDAPYIQFVDADSEVAASWLADATAVLARDPNVAAVHGRVRERRVRNSVYDHLYALEFDPRMEAPDVFGGMAMVRAAALVQVGRYPETMATFEDHELSFRLRRAGWQIRRLDGDMVIHDARMTRWREWWARERRVGHGRAQLVAMHRDDDVREWRRAYASIWFWALGLPLLIGGATWLWGWAALALTLAYPAQLYRVCRRMHRRGFSAADAALYAAARLVAKFPQLHGALSFLRQTRGAT